MGFVLLALMGFGLASSAFGMFSGADDDPVNEPEDGPADPAPLPTPADPAAPSVADFATVEAGGTDDDTIRGRDAGTGLFGGEGDDFMVARAGATALGGEGDDLIRLFDAVGFGGDGDDTIHIRRGPVTAMGGAGDDFINDWISGDLTLLESTGNSAFYGGEGDDRLSFRHLDDNDATISGGAGDDVIQLAEARSSDTAEGTRLIWLGDGMDTLQVRATLDPDQAQNRGATYDVQDFVPARTASFSTSGVFLTGGLPWATRPGSARALCKPWARTA